MKRAPKKSNPILEPYLPRFREILWIRSGFEEAFTQDYKHFHAVTYRTGVEYFQAQANRILEFPSRKQVDALMEMLLFVSVYNFFVNVDHYDALLVQVIDSLKNNFDKYEDRILATQKRYDRFKSKYTKWCNEYIEKCQILPSMLPSDSHIGDALYSSTEFAAATRYTFKHYLDTAKTLNAPEIIDFNWSNLSIHDLITKLREREKQVREKLKKQHKLLPQGQVWIEFEDGARWVYLPKPQCREIGVEGDHCATVESWMGRNFGRLLYFADSEGDLKLTASYAHLNDWYKEAQEIKELDEGTDYGVLGQIRGNYNTKPKKEYLKYIAALLCDERVIKHIPDSYRDDDQFKIEDLDSLQIGIIESRNPSVIDFSKAAEFVPVRALLVLLRLFANNKFQVVNYDGKIDVTKPNPKALIALWESDAEGFFEALGQKQAAQLFEFLKSGDDLFDFDYHKEDIENFIEDLSEKELKTVYAKLTELGHKPESEKWKDILTAVKECDEMEGAIGGAIMSGYRAGSEAEAYKQLESRVEELAKILSNEKKLLIKIDSLYGDKGIRIHIALENLLETFINKDDAMGIESNFDSSLGHYAEILDDEIAETRNQFDNYYEHDSEAAKEDFFGYRILDL
jgi:hypothetical protein